MPHASPILWVPVLVFSFVFMLLVLFKRWFVSVFVRIVC